MNPEGYHLWTVEAVKRHADGGSTLTLRSKHTDVVKVENYPPGHVLFKTASS